MDQKRVDNWFLESGDQYQKYRPSYPQILGTFLASLVSQHRRALDVGCGTGQLTKLLASSFHKVIGIDQSESQIDHAQACDNVTYYVSSAENFPSTIVDIDLITVAQAAHWLDLPLFYQEVKRVSSSNAVIALISYGVIVTDSPLYERIMQFYKDEIGCYWPDERKMVDEGYQNIYFPFKELPVEILNIEKRWCLKEFLGYISTWSAVKKARDTGNRVVLEKFYDEIGQLWGDPLQKYRFTWPINMRVGAVFA